MVFLSVHVWLDWATDQITTTPNLPITVSNLDVQTMLFFYSSKTLLGELYMRTQNVYSTREWKLIMTRGGEGVLYLRGLLHGLHVVWKYKTEPDTAYIYTSRGLNKRFCFSLSRRTPPGVSDTEVLKLALLHYFYTTVVNVEDQKKGLAILIFRPRSTS